MPETSFWLDLANSFHQLQQEYSNKLGAQWISSEWNESGNQWQLDGGASGNVRDRFRMLALRGAAGLGHSEESTALVFWLNALKRESPSYKQDGQSTDSLPDGMQIVAAIGSIRLVCRASADFCRHCETRELFRLNRADGQMEISPIVPVEAFLDEAQAIWVRGVPDQNKILKQQLSNLHDQDLSFDGRASHAISIYRMQWATRVKDRIGAYKQVAHKRKSVEMLSEARVGEFRERIIQTIGLAIQQLQFHIVHDHFASGAVDPLPLATRYTTLYKDLVDVADSELKVLKAAGEVETEEHTTVEAQPASAITRPRPRQPVRQNQRYLDIDKALFEIAEARPKDQKEIFDLLNERVPCPSAEPFRSARGWVKGFENREAAARSWLSKAWRRLDLPPLLRGPK
jgi:hypothetical protein